MTTGLALLRQAILPGSAAVLSAAAAGPTLSSAAVGLFVRHRYFCGGWMNTCAKRIVVN